MKVPRIEGLSDKEEGTRGSLSYLLDKIKSDRQTWAKVMTVGNKYKQMLESMTREPIRQHLTNHDK